MRPEVKVIVQEWYDRYIRSAKDPALVVELGSYDVNGNFRDIFQREQYVGVDMREGPNVDVVQDAHRLDEKFEPGTVDAIVCCDTFEHDAAFWLTLDQIYTALVKPGGRFICSVPSIWFQTYHPNPDDYWRFTDTSFDKIIFYPGRYKMLDRRSVKTAELADTLIGIGEVR